MSSKQQSGRQRTDAKTQPQARCFSQKVAYSLQLES